MWRSKAQFWRERLETVLTRTIPSQHVQLGKHGILESLTLPNPPPPLRFPRNEHNFTVQVFWDSDVGKWIEAASYALSHRRDADIEAKIEAIVDDLEKAQAPDGYLNCWYLQREPDKRWTNLRDNHELYNLGHLLEGGIAYFLATGRRRLLDILERYVEHVRQTFGPAPGQRRGYCGHQEIELALVKLYRLTGERKHLDLAAYFIDERGRQPHYFDREALARGERPEDFWAKSYEYNQSHKPVREQTKVVGHAVRAMYMFSAMADLAAELDDTALKRACEVLWADVMASKIYITSGLGPAAANEGFTEDYDLPNDTAYAETCASVALIFWAQRMLHLDLDGRYADVMEQALFNGALTGLSRDGEHYFYSNPLDSDGRHSRWAWHTCPCCTMNSSRLVASVGGYFVSASDDAIAFHLYGGIATTRAARQRRRGAAGNQHLSLVRLDQHRGRPRGAGRLHRQAPHPGLGERGRGVGQRRAGRRHGRNDERLPVHRPAMARRRHDRPRTADARRADLRAPRCQGRHRPRRPEARTAGLLRRGDGQSRRPGAAAEAAPHRERRASDARRSLRRHRHLDRLGGARGRVRLGRRPLQECAAAGHAEPPHGHSLLSLEQSREGLDAGLGIGGVKANAA